MNFILFIALFLQTSEEVKRPTHGLSIPIQIVDVYDGDTLTVEIKFRVKVRLLDCWSPEVRTRDLEEKKRGLAARDFVRGIALNKKGTLWIPSRNVKTIGNLLSFDRVLGHIWVSDDKKSLSETVVEAGHATKTKVK